MWEKALVILLIIAAAVGLICYVRREQKADACSGCKDCPIRQKCTKPEKKEAS